MKRMEVAGEIYEAEKIYLSEESIKGVDKSGTKLFEFVGIKNNGQFKILDGLAFDIPETEAATITTALMGGEEMANEQVAGQFRKAVQMFAQTLGEEEAMEIADLYPEWQPDKAYKPGTILKHGKNEKGKGQLYSVMQQHKSQKDWLPGPAMEALYKKIGFSESGVAMWVQPQGGHDAYKLKDVVMHNGKKWESTAKDNVWEPGVYGWVEIS